MVLIWRVLLVQEAVFKALHPILQRRIGFKEVEVHPSNGGMCEIELMDPVASELRSGCADTELAVSGAWTSHAFPGARRKF